MRRRSASRGILYTAPPSGTRDEDETEATEPAVDASESTETAAADD